MGCGSSKINRPQAEIMPKLPPIISRKIEEIRRHRGGGNNLSKKQLLNNGSEEDSHPRHCNDHKSDDSSSMDHDKDSLGSPKVAPEPISDHHKEVIRAKNIQQDYNNNSNKDKDVKHEDEEDDDDVTKTLEKLGLEETDDEIEDQYGRLSNVGGSLTCPASPSFRVYYIESLQHKDIDDDIEEDDHQLELDIGKDYIITKGSLSDTDVVSQKSSEESTSETKIINKKRRRGMKFRRVIPKGKPVRKFLSVKSCYYPMSCGGRRHELTRLVSAKAAATS
ncbi:hypothetical protein CCACVL1_08595 [Corchorus capsularis]|uniref:Uncharacterized protein n=1 Tax=Corchorus capsularis TaxID=210143 RepID=A0A1R3IZJ0_COCAP|nr:hypothetical protein CCACVL1_08595 [Corchorus capsularis]